MNMGNQDNEKGNNGHGKNKYFQGYKQNNHKKKNVEDHTLYLGRIKRLSDFDETKYFVINHIQKTHEFGNGIEKAYEQKPKLML